ncbi:MAG: SDR family NAD(P)-dependent oxidoreductase, partial [Gammaproteobacteria bacterium]|nr:SDR family NAD(P)-dependent oxidoreductase [Gammaproteobacteria bacterium]
MQGLNDKVVICTGSGRSKGLGAAIVRRLAQEGCKIVITDLGEATSDLTADNIGATAEMEAVANEVRELGAECIV